MITVSCFSNFWEINRLENTKSTTVIKKLKLSLHGMACHVFVVTDNRPQFTSTNFENFSRNYDFEHQTSSLYSSKSNGKAESAVKTAQKTQVLLRKNRDGDQFLALLNYKKHSNSSHRNKPRATFSQRKNTDTSPYHRKTPETQGQSRTGERKIATEPEEAE